MAKLLSTAGFSVVVLKQGGGAIPEPRSIAVAPTRTAHPIGRRFEIRWSLPPGASQIPRRLRRLLSGCDSGPERIKSRFGPRGAIAIGSASRAM
jgi:hypothetical protein